MSAISLPENMEYFDSLSMAVPDVPPRSRLHCLPPIGIGTSRVESLTGFISRLAQAHGLSMAVMFGCELAQHVKNGFLEKRLQSSNKSMILASSFRGLSPALNGHGSIASQWVLALEALTMRSDLCYLTMLTWNNAISHRGLIRHIKAWCPACYNEMHVGNQIIYEPLLWSLEAVKACSIHHYGLRIHCQHCNRQLYHLDSRSRPGHCSSCGQWLGEALNGEHSTYLSSGARELFLKDDIEWQIWASMQVGEILAAAPQLASKPSREVVARSTKACLEYKEIRSALALSRISNIPSQTINNWRRGRHSSGLEALLRLCYFTGLSPLSFLKGENEVLNARLSQRTCQLNKGITSETERIEFLRVDDEKANEDISVLARDHKSAKTHKRAYRRIDAEKVKPILKAAMSERPPPSLIEVARRSAHQSNSLRYQFPGECRKIVRRYTTYRRNRRCEKWKKGRLALEAALVDKRQSSIEDVAKSIGWNFNLLRRRFPALCRRVSRRYVELLRNKWSQVELALKEIIKEQPPPSMRSVTERIGYSDSSLYSHFPALCRNIADRYVGYRSEQFEKERNTFLEDVRQTALAIYNEGSYPSVKQVEAHLSIRKSLRSNKKALDVLRELREQYGLNSRAYHPTRF